RRASGVRPLGGRTYGHRRAGARRGGRATPRGQGRARDRALPWGFGAGATLLFSFSWGGPIPAAAARHFGAERSPVLPVRVNFLLTQASRRLAAVSRCQPDDHVAVALRGPAEGHELVHGDTDQVAPQPSAGRSDGFSPREAIP